MIQRLMTLSCAAALAAAGSTATAQDFSYGMPGTDWTGGYVGGQLGWGWAGGDASLRVDGDNYDADVEGNGLNYGVALGYRQDMGSWVVGAETAFDWSDTRFEDVDVGLADDVDDAGTLKDVLRFVGTVGYDGGRVLYYGAAGWARGTIQSDSGGYSENGGWVVGAGADYMLTDRVSLGGQLLYYNFDDISGDDESFDLGVTRLQLKATYRF